MKSKNSFPIKKEEKELYHIFKDLQKYGRTTYHYPDISKQQSISRIIGKRAKPLIQKNLIHPPLSSTNKWRITGIQLPKNVTIIEKKTPYGSRFYFTRRNNIL